MVGKLKYPEELQERIDERTRVSLEQGAKSEYREYGNWTRVDGELEEIPDIVIEEVKAQLYENATQTLEDIGVDIGNQEIEWIVRQAYYNGDKFVFDNDPEGKPCVTVAWKTKVKKNG